MGDLISIDRACEKDNVPELTLRAVIKRNALTAGSRTSLRRLHAGELLLIPTRCTSEEN